jgi:general secretion pathway protein F
MKRAAYYLSFFEGLLALLEGNASLSDALFILSRGETDRFVKETAARLLTRMKKGWRFSDCLEDMSGGITQIHRALLCAAETTGNIAPALVAILADLRRKRHAREEVLTALIYPAIIILASGVGTAFLLVKGIPFFVQSGFLSGDSLEQAESGVLVAGLFLLCAGALFFVVCFRLFGEDPPETTVFYLLSLLLEHNIPLSEALSRCIGALGRTKQAGALVLIKKEIEAGARVSRAFGENALCSVYARNWLAVADENGNIAGAFHTLYDYYRKQDERRRSLAARCIEPGAILITGIYILMLLEAVILPLLTRAGGAL